MSVRVTQVWFDAAAGAGGSATVNAPLGTLTLTKYNPTVTAIGTASVSVPKGTLTLTKYDPTITAVGTASVSVPKGELTLTGNNPTVTAYAGTTVNVPTGELTLTDYAPVVTATQNRLIDVPNETLTLTEYAPTVTAYTGTTISVPKGELALTKYDPVVSITNHITVSVPVGSLLLTKYAPIVIATGSGSSRVHKEQKREYQSVSWAMDWQQPIIKQAEKILDADVVTTLKASRNTQPPSQYLDSLTDQLELYIQHLEDTITDLANASKVISKMDKYAKLVTKINQLAKDQRNQEIKQGLQQKVLVKKKKIQEQRELKEVQMLVTIYNNYFAD